MNGIWHLVRKDVRHMAPAVGLWILVMLAVAAGFAQLGVSVESASRGESVEWVDVVGTIGALVMIFEHVAGVLLAAVLIIEDSPASNAGFWVTRPINRWRMLAAKCVSALLLLVLGPTVALLPVWWAADFSGEELLRAALEFATWRTVITLSAIAIAAVAGTLTRFLALVLAVGVAELLTLILVDALVRPPPNEIGASAVFMANVALCAGALWILVRQYVGPRRPAWVSLTVVVALIGFLHVGWKWDLSGRITALKSRLESEPLRGDSRVLVRAETLSDSGSTLSLRVDPGTSADMFFAPTAGVVQLNQANGTIVGFNLIKGPRWGDDAARRAAGLPSPATSHAWEMIVAHSGGGGREFAPPMTATGLVTIEVMRGHVLWEIPLQDDARGGSGAASARVAAVIPIGEYQEKRLVTLEERDSRLTMQHGVVRAWLRGMEYESRHHDCYLLVNRETGYARLLPPGTRGGAYLHSLTLRVTTLAYESLDADPAARTMLVKVRFESERAFRSALTPGPVQMQSEEATP